MVGISAITGGFEAVSVSVRLCRYCGNPLPDGSPLSRLYCSAHCRRRYQDERRKAERAEAAELRQVDTKPISDPWGRCDLDDWTAEEILANAMLDPLPAGLDWDNVGNVKDTSREVLSKDEARSRAGNAKVTLRFAKRKARRKSRRERRRRLR